MTKAVHFTELAVRKAVKAARKSGLNVGAVSIAPDGTITIQQQVAKPLTASPSDSEADNWSNA